MFFRRISVTKIRNLHQALGLNCIKTLPFRERMFYTNQDIAQLTERGETQ